jgi:hypothetical protein
MKRIGILYGLEQSFPQALLKEINSGKYGDIRSELLKIGTIKTGELFDYSVILDRASDEVPFYRSVMKLADTNGIRVVNDPKLSHSYDHFLQAAIANLKGINTPRIVILPSKERPPGTTADNLRNLIYPLNWDETFDYIGFPAYIKPNSKTSSLSPYKVYSQKEFFSVYDLTGSCVMLLQEYINYDRYYFCYTIGGDFSKSLKYDPVKPYHLRFDHKNNEQDTEFMKEIERLALVISNELGMDFSAVEFAVKQDKIYAIRLANLVPAIEESILTPEVFENIVQKTAEFLMKV